MFDTFTECYNEMKKGCNRSDYFHSLWPIDSGFLKDNERIKEITPENVYKFIDKLED